MDEPAKTTTDQDHARSLWLRTEDVVKLRLVLSAILRVLGIAMIPHNGYMAVMWVVHGTYQQSSLGWILLWAGQSALLAALGAILAYFSPWLATRLVPARITSLRCPDCDYELTVLKDGRCTECNYLLSPLRPDPATPSERALMIRAVFTAIYRMIGLALAAWAIHGLAWITLSAAFGMESMLDWFSQEEIAIDAFMLYRVLVAAMGAVVLFAAPWISRLTVPPLIAGNTEKQAEA